LAIIGAFIATIIEIIPWPLNDNFWMPLITAGLLGLIRKLVL
jgi:dolichol kinase